MFEKHPHQIVLVFEDQLLVQIVAEYVVRVFRSITDTSQITRVSTLRLELTVFERLREFNSHLFTDPKFKLICFICSSVVSTLIMQPLQSNLCFFLHRDFDAGIFKGGSSLDIFTFLMRHVSSKAEQRRLNNSIHISSQFCLSNK